MLTTDRWPLGTRFRHYAGSEWEVIEVLGGEYDDRRIRCVVDGPGSGGGVGTEITVHGEYIPRSMKVVQVVLPQSDDNERTS